MENKMSKKSDRTIYQRSDGEWVNKRNDTGRASSLHNAQGNAVQEAKRNLQNQGGGELTIQGRDKKFQSKDTIKPGKNPFPPRDTEH